MTSLERMSLVDRDNCKSLSPTYTDKCCICFKAGKQ